MKPSLVARLWFLILVSLQLGAQDPSQSSVFAHIALPNDTAKAVPNTGLILLLKHMGAIPISADLYVLSGRPRGIEPITPYSGNRSLGEAIVEKLKTALKGCDGSSAEYRGYQVSCFHVFDTLIAEKKGKEQNLGVVMADGRSYGLFGVGFDSVAHSIVVDVRLNSDAGPSQISNRVPAANRQNSLAPLPTRDRRTLERLGSECASGNANSCLKLQKIALTQRDSRLRLAAIAVIRDQPVLTKIALGDPETPIRQAALAALSSQPEIANVALLSKDPDLEAAAVERLAAQEELARVAATPTASIPLRVAAVKKLSTQEILVRILTTERNEAIALTALQNIRTFDALAEAALRAPLVVVRRSAVTGLRDQKVLEQVAATDPDASVRGEAVKRLTDQGVLTSIALRDSNASVRQAAAGRVKDEEWLAQLSRDAGDSAIRRLAIQGLKTPEHLTEAARRDSSPGLRKLAIARITDQAALQSISRSEADAPVRAAALGRITDQSLIEALVMEGAPAVRREALNRLNDPIALERVVRSVADNTVQSLALNRISQNDILARLAASLSGTLRANAVARMSDDGLVWKTAESTSDPELVELAIAHIKDQSILSKIAGSARSEATAAAAIEKVSDATALAGLLRTSAFPQVRMTAVRRIEDQALLAKTARQDKSDVVRIEAIWRLNDAATLRAAASSDPVARVRSSASARLARISGRELADLVDSNAVEVEVTGSGIETVTVRLRRKVKERLQVIIPAGAYFVSSSGSYQNMVTRHSEPVTLNNDEWVSLSIDAACANLFRDIPKENQNFTVKRRPDSELLARLMAELDAAKPGYYVEQAAVWIVTDDASYSNMGVLVRRSAFQPFGGTRPINEPEVAQALRICDRVGMDVTRRRIWKDAPAILAALPQAFDPAVKTWLRSKLQAAK